MSRPLPVAIALFVPIFLAVVAIVRALWLAYLATLTESQLHLRVFDHSTTVALTLWGGCLVLAALLSLTFARLLVRYAARRRHT